MNVAESFMCHEKSIINKVDFSKNIRIGNLRKGAELKPLPDETVVFCDRRNPVFGNPFLLEDKNNDHLRDLVINKFSVKFKDDWINKGPMFKECFRLGQLLLEGQKIILMCWCAGSPTNKRCHSEIIMKKIIDSALFLQSKL